MAKKKKRAAKGSGSFYYNEQKNRFEYRITYYDNYDQAQKKTFYGASKAICLEKAEEFLNRQKRGLSDHQESITIPQILKFKYSEQFESNNIIESTYRRKLYTVQIIENSPIGKIPVIDIKERHIREFLNSIKRYSNSTIKKVYAAANNALDDAIKEGIIDENLMKKRFKIPKSDKEDKKVYAFTYDEQKVFIDALENNYHKAKNRNYYKNQMLLSLYTGMRIGEVNALELIDVDLEGGFLYVRRTITSDLKDNAILGKTTKTFSGNRVLLLTENTKKILKDAIDNYVPNSNELIFCDVKTKGPIRTANVNSAFTRICKKVGLPFHGVHSLRHTYATRAIENGIEPVTLKNWMGHKDISITLNTYTDVFAKMETKALELMNQFEIKI